MVYVFRTYCKCNTASQRLEASCFPLLPRAPAPLRHRQLKPPRGVQNDKGMQMLPAEPAGAPEPPKPRGEGGKRHSRRGTALLQRQIRTRAPLRRHGRSTRPRTRNTTRMGTGRSGRAVAGPSVLGSLLHLRLPLGFRLQVSALPFLKAPLLLLALRLAEREESSATSISLIRSRTGRSDAWAN